MGMIMVCCFIGLWFSAFTLYNRLERQEAETEELQDKMREVYITFKPTDDGQLIESPKVYVDTLVAERVLLAESLGAHPGSHISATDILQVVRSDVNELRSVVEVRFALIRSEMRDVLEALNKSIGEMLDFRNEMTGTTIKVIMRNLADLMDRQEKLERSSRQSIGE